MNKNSKIYIAGHTGLVGSAITCRLIKDGYVNLVTVPSRELNLLDEKAVIDFFNKEKPEYVFFAAGRVGGIVANDTYSGEFIYENLKIQCNILHSAYKIDVRKLLWLGCSCLYPKDCPQPIKEKYLLTGPFEPTNEAYSTAKIAGLKMCQAYRRQYKTDFICGISDNLYGPNDNFNSGDSHVIPALIKRFHTAKINGESSVTIWGSGKPRRGFLYVDDLADACIFLMLNYNSIESINIGQGSDVSISELAKTIQDVVNFKGSIQFDSTKPDGMPRKFLDTTNINSLGWRPKKSFREGLEDTYKWYIQEEKGVSLE